MADDIGQQYAVPRYRDPEKAARIVEARRGGDRCTDIAAREGVSRQRVWLVLRDAGLTVRNASTPSPKPCAWCGKLLRDRSKIYCSRKCATAANAVNPVGRDAYERRRDSGATWREIAAAAAPERLDPPQLEQRAAASRRAARRYAKACGLPWPATSESMARRDERGLAQVRELVEEERQVLALADELPKDRTITQPEVERFLVDLYRIGMTSSHIAGRTNCAVSYVLKAVRRLAPELIRSPGAPERKRKRQGEAPPLLDIQELRNIWRGEERLRQRDRQDARMSAAWLSGESLQDIARRESISRDAVRRRIAGVSVPRAATRRRAAKEDPM